MDSTRGYSDGSVLPMTFAEIHSWAQLMGTHPSPPEIEILRAMDGARIRIWNERKGDKEPDRLIDVKDSSGLATLLRGMGGKE